MSLQLIPSSDGSHTLLSHFYGATYHSRNGAIQESVFVFINAGLDFLKQQGVKDFRIFELGFGTGLNCLLSYQYALEHELNIAYTGIDTFPVSRDITKSLNYGDHLNCLPAFESLTDMPWGTKQNLSPDFSILKQEISFQEFVAEKAFNLFYMDAFGPATQPELWNESSILKMFDMLENGGVLVTYCAQGQFKRNLKNAGFRIESLSGPPGKREMVRAFKN